MTPEEKQKIRAITDAITSAEGVPIPFGLARKISEVYGGLMELQTKED